ncbi:hypothetical protein XM53_08985 [Roseovarius atlanticus]|uniref:Amidase domain-containing protein n=2 Tax=Roseovarius atlanticus TaxID=1641875 RepID=A0A0T5NUW6_9RHOB|nr:hypothetical protein XM53_08985 [Roseovarius atlanticus]
MSALSKNTPGALETARLIAAGQLTATQAVQQRLEIVKDLEPNLKAWVSIHESEAIEAAQMIDSMPVSGKIHGVPIAIKDIFAVKGMPWHCGSELWKGRTAEFDAGSVALARRAGGIVLGKTETTEFAFYQPTRTRNPHDLSRTPGGSSSGSAAAVASGMVPLAFGTQTSGSIIRPASFCGIVGFKPSFDLIETGGVAPLSRSLDTVGVFARSVPDASLLVEALTGLNLQPDASANPTKLPVYRSPVWDQAEPELVSAWSAFEEGLAAKFSVHKFAPEIELALAEAPDLHARIMAAEAAEALAYEYAEGPETLSEALRAELEKGSAISADERLRDRQAMRSLRHLVEGLVPRNAVWLTPSSTGPAPLFETGTGSPSFNRIWSLLGLPCCSVPLLQTHDGLPMGVQVVGAMGNDGGVLTVADWLMARFGQCWSQQN